MKSRIYRRAFNPKEINGTVQPNPKQLVATFQSGMDTEANYFLARLQELQSSFALPTCFSEWRYTLVKDAPPPESAAAHDDIIVDTSTAKRTHRPIAYSLSWRIPSGSDRCEIIAFHERYGAIRADVDDSPAARQLFVRRLTSIWPNATQKR